MYGSMYRFLRLKTYINCLSGRLYQHHTTFMPLQEISMQILNLSVMSISSCSDLIKELASLGVVILRWRVAHLQVYWPTGMVSHLSIFPKINQHKPGVQRVLLFFHSPLLQLIHFQHPTMSNNRTASSHYIWGRCINAPLGPPPVTLIISSLMMVYWSNMQSWVVMITSSPNSHSSLTSSAQDMWLGIAMASSPKQANWLV